MSKLKMLITLAAFCTLIHLSIGFYVPGVSPIAYHDEDHIPVKAVKLTSPMTQVPYNYYSLPFCKPKAGEIYEAENFGEILRGDRVVTAGYVVAMKLKVKCVTVCDAFSLTKEQVNSFIDLIKNEYSVHLLVDNLPAATTLVASDNKEHFELGHRVGYINNDKIYLNTHLKFLLKYHSVGDGSRVVGVIVATESVHLSDKNADVCQTLLAGPPHSLLELKVDEPATVAFTYEVAWEESSIQWASRWDVYLSGGHGQIHWFSIVNSLIIIMFLAAIMSMIFFRTLRRDIAKYNREDDSEDILEESGWKLVHGDVFRPPRHSSLLVIVIGSGVQLFTMASIVLFFAVLGMLSPAARGALLNAIIFTYVFMGVVAGYFAGRLYKSLRGYHWKTTATLTGLFYPTLVLGVGFVINCFLWAKGSSAALPFSTMVAILCLWWGISLPLNFLGFYFGYRKRAYEQPVRTNQIPRAVPDRNWPHGLCTAAMLGGMFPFAGVFIELYFVLNAIWDRQIYYLFGFLFIVFLILTISCAQVSIVMTYFQLCSEDYHWWWRSVVVSGSSAIYVFGYTIFYFITKMEITSFVAAIIYFGYSLLLAVTFFIITGTIGFYAAHFFVLKIYAAIKID